MPTASIVTYPLALYGYVNKHMDISSKSVWAYRISPHGHIRNSIWKSRLCLCGHNKMFNVCIRSAPPRLTADLFPKYGHIWTYAYVHMNIFAEAVGRWSGRRLRLKMRTRHGPTNQWLKRASRDSALDLNSNINQTSISVSVAVRQNNKTTLKYQ